MDLELNGRRALVSGSSGGIGREIAAHLASEGARVVVHGRNEARTRAVASEIAASGGRTAVALGPVDTDGGAAEVWAQAESAWGGIDILVNNAGSFEVCGWSEATPRRWAETLETNTLSAVRLIQAAVPGMRASGWGRIVNISSVSATLGPPLFPDYAAAKAALLNVTLSLSKELAGTGVTVNTVSPGAVRTGAWERFALQIAALQGWGEDMDAIISKLLGGFLSNPSGRLGTPADIAAMVTFLASPRAGYVNGMNVRVDGGLDASLA